MLFDIWVIDLTSNICHLFAASVEAEEVGDFKSMMDKPGHIALDGHIAVRVDCLDVVVPSGYEVVNREEQARKLGSIASQMLDLAFGQAEQDDELSSLHLAFHEAVSNGPKCSICDSENEVSA